MEVVRQLIDERPTYGYRKIGAVLNRECAKSGLPHLNHKRLGRGNYLICSDWEALLEFIFSLASDLTIDTRSSQQVWLAYRRIPLSTGNASEAAELAAKAYEAGTHTDDPASPSVVAAKTA